MYPSRRPGFLYLHDQFQLLTLNDRSHLVELDGPSGTGEE